VRVSRKTAQISNVSENIEDNAASENAVESENRLRQLVPVDQTSRKRVLASLLRALNSDNRN